MSLYASLICLFAYSFNSHVRLSIFSSSLVSFCLVCFPFLDYFFFILLLLIPAPSSPRLYNLSTPSLSPLLLHNFMFLLFHSVCFVFLPLTSLSLQAFVIGSSSPSFHFFIVPLCACLYYFNLSNLTVQLFQASSFCFCSSFTLLLYYPVLFIIFQFGYFVFLFHFPTSFLCWFTLSLVRSPIF